VAPDVLALPGEPVRIEVRLRKASPAWQPKPLAVYLFRGDALYHVALTDANGTMAADFTPPAAGDYFFRVECYVPSNPDGRPLETTVLVACREANAPLFVADIDETLSDQRRKREVLLGDPNAMPGSVNVMTRLAKDRTVVYLTHRWEYMNKRTRDWLSRKGYPSGPILAARGFSQLLEDNEKYKERELAALRERFRGPGFGVGDKASDVRAYEKAGLRGILFLDLDDVRKPEAARAALRELDALPPASQAAADWGEVEKIAIDGNTLPPAAARERVGNLLREMERRK